MKKLSILLILFISISISAQQGGMWIPSLLKGMNETEMKNLGSKLSAEDIYSINNSSLKDAIGHFNGGCTSEVISKKGLILTNHHCGYSQVQSHSSVENDYLKNGFWAKELKNELPNKGLFVEFIIRIEDVTKKAFEGVTESMEANKKQALINKNISKIKKNAKKETWQIAKIKAFYKGNQYFLFIKERFEDIRLVGAPPSSIGKFGNDTDNWMFPRHTGDFSLFRIYADKNNKPAKYSKDNIPYTPKHFLPVSLDGVSENDFTLVFGFPGTTNEYLPSFAIKHITQEYNPSNIHIRNEALKVINAKMKTNDEIRIKYASKQARIANYWKKWIGENQGIKKSNAIAKREKFENKFTSKLNEKGLTAKYGKVLPELRKRYKEFAPINIKRRNFIETFIINNELLKICFRAYMFEQGVSINPKSLEKHKKTFTDQLESIHKNYDKNLDLEVYKVIMPLYTKDLKPEVYETTVFTDLNKAKSILKGTHEQVLKNLQEDPAYQYAKPFIAEFFNVINKQYYAKNDEVEYLLKKYMKAQMEVMPDERYFPDANSSLRITYGKVKGYSPRDAVYYKPVSYLEGIVEKFVPGDYEFDVPKKLIELYNRKDYGRYADKNGKMPVCFLGTNHTTGGNSGSPAIDANGNLIGLNFDRVWEGTMSDMNYDPNICRNIMVDARYILFIIDKYAGATRLIDEMKLVHPKKNKETKKWFQFWK